eukprot:TRINITY_DN2683_c0_g2_i1.p1 TRINITY_DN2683_c0_g2~~TRINITY_DN2683_c0_g2_i1.p1  ORF type:complete len:1576 (+),score=527.56 TRINITY_DN2683_c0_g2_i1:266-4993(+)
MALQLKVRLPATGVTRAIRFAGQMSIYEACKTIAEKSTDVGGADHALFKPLTEDMGTKGGKWLKMEKTLDSYDLNTNDLVEYRKRHEAIKVKLVDDTTKTFLVDISDTVAGVVSHIGEKMSLRNSEEFSLQVEGNEGKWLETDMCLSEQVNTDVVFLFRKRFHVTDGAIDKDDPINLHLLYVQSRGDVLAGKHPTQKDEAVQLAAIQSQVDFGNVNSNSKVDVKAVTAPQWHKEKGIDKLILAEWKKLVNVSDLHAKYRYVQFCRSLKTYGITVFHVKERSKQNKKLVQKLLGFTRDAIMKMDETCKVEKQWPLVHMKRWASSPETFTMDFGGHEVDYVTVITQEGEEISALIAGYIDILMKKGKGSTVVIEDDQSQIGEVTTMSRAGGVGAYSTTSSTGYGGYANISGSVGDLESAATAISRMTASLFGAVGPMEGGNRLTAEQRKQQITDQTRALEQLAQKFIQMMVDPTVIDKTAMNTLSKQLAVGLENLIEATRAASALGLDTDGYLFDGVKDLAECLQSLLGFGTDVVKNPFDNDAKAKLHGATLNVQAALAKLKAIGQGVKTDDSFQKLLLEFGRSIDIITEDLVNTALNSQYDPAKESQVRQAAKQASDSCEHLVSMATILAPTAQDPTCQKTLENSATALEKAAATLHQVSKSAGVRGEEIERMEWSLQALRDALANLLKVGGLPHLQGGRSAQEFSAAAQTILEATTSLMGSAGRPDLVRSGCAIVGNTSSKLNAAALTLAQSLDPSSKQRLLDYAQRVADAVKGLMAVAPKSAANPNDAAAHTALRNASTKVAEAVQTLVSDAGEKVALNSLYASAKYAAAATTSLVSASSRAEYYLEDPASQQALANAAMTTSRAIADLVQAMKNVVENGDEASMSASAEMLMTAAEKFTPTAYKLVASAKSTVPKILDEVTKKDLAYSADNAAKNIHKLLLNRKAAKAKLGMNEASAAMDQFHAAEAELEAALLSVKQGLLDKSNESRENAVKNLNAAIKLFANATKDVSSAAKEEPENLGEQLRILAKNIQSLVEEAKIVCGTVDDINLQKSVLQGVKAIIAETRSLMQTSQLVVSNPQDPNLISLLQEAAKSVASSLVKLVTSLKAIVPKGVEDFQKKSADDIEDLAERELAGAASVITNAVARILKAQEEAKARRSMPDINLGEQDITEAILEAAHALGLATSVLMVSAGQVQSEFNKLVKTDTKAVYKRDPTWAQGLISASREVAGSVKYLVEVSDLAAKGETKREALIIATQEVSASTTRLVTASTVKNVNPETQTRLTDASKKINAATRALVEAANMAADWEPQELAPEDEKYAMRPEKVREMEEQMEILRLERELELKRQRLLEKRKQQYAEATSKPATDTIAPPATTMRRAAPTPAAPQPTPASGAANAPQPNRGGPSTMRRGPAPNNGTLSPSTKRAMPPPPPDTSAAPLPPPIVEAPPPTKPALPPRRPTGDGTMARPSPNRGPPVNGGPPPTKSASPSAPPPQRSGEPNPGFVAARPSTLRGNQNGDSSAPAPPPRGRRVSIGPLRTGAQIMPPVEPAEQPPEESTTGRVAWRKSGFYHAQQ